MTGTSFNQYQITAKLGSGGMGEVFRARDTRLNREVAIKVLPKCFAPDPERLHRFEQEAKTLAALNHPNILIIHDAGAQEGAPYLVSELLEGQTLREALAGVDGAILPVRKAIEYAVQIAQGLAAAHGKGIVHRDLKPENIFVTKDGRVKILDFGLAKLQEPALDSQISDLKSPPDDSAPTVVQTTQPGVLLGTPSYMAPEQVRGEPADHRSDIFAFGCLLYEMLSGIRAFKRGTPVESMHAILREEPRDLARTNPEIPLSLERIVRRCLDKERDHRFQSARDLVFALEDAGSAAASSGRPLETAVPDRSPPRVLRVLPWALAAGLTGAVCLLLWWPAEPFRDGSRAVEPRSLRKYDLTLPLSPRPLVNGDLFCPVISPDGKKIAYANSDGLWLRYLHQLTPVQLTTGNNLASPFWSPESTDLGYFEGRKLSRVSIDGGRPALICTVPEDASGGASGGAWLTRDRIVFGTGWSGLYEVSAQGGRVTVVCPLSEGETDFHNPSALPGGRGVLLSVHRTAGIDTLALWRPAGELKTLLQIPGSVCFYPVYSPSGHVVFQRSDEAGGIWAFPFSLEQLERTGEPFRISDVGTIPSVSEDGTLVFGLFDLGEFAPRQLAWLDRGGKVLGTAGPVLAGLGQQRLSPDGRQVLAAAGDNLSGLDIWSIDVTSGSAIPLWRNQEMEASPFWSRDGRMIFFARRGGATSQALTIAADGTGEERVLFTDLQSQTGSANFTMHLGSSGKYLIAGRTSTTGRSTIGYYVLSDPDRSFRAFPEAFQQSAAWCLSPDDRLLAYQSVQSGQIEVYVVEFPTFAKREIVSRNGGRHPMWHPAGKELFFMSATGRELLSARWTVEEGRLKQPSKMFDLPDQVHGGFTWWPSFYDVAPDGERFLMLQNVVEPAAARRPSKPNLLVVQNWSKEFPLMP